MHRQIHARVTRAIALSLWLLCASASHAQSTLEVQFISVGQADATLIRCPDSKRYMLIDSGDRKTGYPQSVEKFQAHMLAEFKGQPRKLDIVVASHAHADHLGSMQWVLENFQVGTYVDSGDKSETDTFSNLEKVRKRLVKKGSLEYVNGKKAKAVELPFCANAGVTVGIFSPWGHSSKLSDANDRSLVVRLTHHKVSFLFLGDAHDKAEKVMLEEMGEEFRKLLDVDVTKVGHHGSDTSSSASFVLATSPQMAVISSGKMKVGTNVRYKHPRSVTIATYGNWFKKADQSMLGSVALPGGKVWAYHEQHDWRQQTRPNGLWLTPADGTIVVRSDGQKLSLVLSPDP